MKTNFQNIVINKTSAQVRKGKALWKVVANYPGQFKLGKAVVISEKQLIKAFSNLK